MDQLSKVKQEIQSLIAANDLPAVLEQLKALLPEKSARLKEVLLLEGRLNDINLRRIRGIVRDEELQVTYNTIRHDLMLLVEQIQPSDLNTDQALSDLDSSGKARQGQVLYQIPATMRLHEESRCIVRIALSDELLVKNLTLINKTEIKDIRVSDLMQVELLGNNKNTPFAIRSTSRKEQFIDKDDYTEWIFFVEPQKEGVYPITIKVAVIEMVHGREAYREIVLEEQVEIVTTQPATDTEPEFKPASYSFGFSSTLDDVQIQYDGGGGRSWLRPVAMSLAFLLAFNAVTWAAVPADYEWVATRYLLNSEQAYQNYIERWEPRKKNHHVETAYFRKAEVTQDTNFYQAYLEKYPVNEAGQPLGKYTEQAAFKVAKLKQSPQALQRYLQDFPEGRFLEEARQAIEQLRGDLETRDWSSEQRTNSSEQSDDEIGDKSNKTPDERSQIPDEKNEASINITPATPAASITDKDGNTYTTAIMADGRRWMTQNLKLNVQDSYCYRDDQVNCEKYGRLYSWEAAKKACASLGDGWRLPSDNEWEKMANKYGDIKNGAGGISLYQSLIQGGSSGFNAVSGYNINIGSGSYWSGTDNQTDHAGIFRFIGSDDEIAIDLYNKPKTTYRSCRCIQGKEQGANNKEQGSEEKGESRNEIGDKSNETPDENEEISITVKPATPAASITDKDGNTYTTAIMADGKRWMTQNLNIEVFESWCYDDDPKNCEEYGRLYSWETAQKACAALGDGWHSPSKKEWETLLMKVGKPKGYSTIYYDKISSKALILNGSSGFSALLGGYRNSNGEYNSLGRIGSYWSTTEFDKGDAWDFYIYSRGLRVSRSKKSYGRSCRCLYY